MKKIITLLLLLVANSSFALSWVPRAFHQDPYFSTTHNSLLLFNPAFAGSNGGFRVQATYRVFEGSFSQNYIAMHNSADIYFKKLKGAVSASWLTDDINRGTLRTNFFSLGYAQHINLAEKVRLIPSLQISYLTRQLDQTSLHFGYFQDPRYGNPSLVSEIPSSKIMNFDASSGVILQASNFYGGISVMHLSRPDIGLLGENPLPRRYNAHISYNFHCSDNSLINVAARHSSQGQSYSQLMVTAVTFNHLITGAGIGYSPDGIYDHFIPVNVNLGYRANFFTCSFLYAHNTTTSSQSAYEVSLSYNLREQDSRKKLTNLEAW